MPLRKTCVYAQMVYDVVLDRLLQSCKIYFLLFQIKHIIDLFNVRSDFLSGSNTRFYKFSETLLQSITQYIFVKYTAVKKVMLVITSSVVSIRF